MADPITLPPQAAAGAPGAAAAAGGGGVVTAPTPTDVLLTSSLGDQGAQDYRDLQTAGQPTVTPTTEHMDTGAPPTAPAAGASSLFGSSGVAGLAGANAPAIVPPQPLSSIDAALLGFATGDPMAARKYNWQLQQHQLAIEQRQLAVIREQRQNEAEFMSQIAPLAFKMFPGQPLQALRFLNGEAVKRGITVPDALILKGVQMLVDGNATPDELHKAFASGDVNTRMRLQDFEDRLNASQQKQSAAKEAASKETAAAAAATPEMLEYRRQQAALKTAQELRQLNQPPNPNQLDALTAGNRIATRVPVPGVPGAFQYDSRVNDGTKQPGDIDVDEVHRQEAKKVYDQTLARQAATTTAATKSMQEQAPTVQYFIRNVQTDLQNINKQGPTALAAFAAQDSDRLNALNTVRTDDLDLNTDQGINTAQARIRSALATRGVTDQAYMRYLTDVNLLRVALMKMHVGMRGGLSMLDAFKEDLNGSVQSSENMNAVLGRINSYANFLQSDAAKKSWNFDEVYPRKTPAGAPTGTAPEAVYKSLTDIQAAVKAGTLTRDQGIQAARAGGWIQ